MVWERKLCNLWIYCRLNGVHDIEFARIPHTKKIGFMKRLDMMLTLSKNTSNKSMSSHIFHRFYRFFSLSLLPIPCIFLLIFRSYINNCPVFSKWPKTAHVSWKRIRTEYLHVVKIIFTENYALFGDNQWSQMISKFANVFAFYTIWLHTAFTLVRWLVLILKRHNQVKPVVFMLSCWMFNHQNCQDLWKIHQFQDDLSARNKNISNLMQSTWTIERWTIYRLEDWICHKICLYIRYDNHARNHLKQICLLYNSKI